MLKSLFLLCISNYTTVFLLLIPLILLDSTCIAHSSDPHPHHHNQHQHHNHNKHDLATNEKNGEGNKTEHNHDHRHHRGCGTEDPTEEEIIETERVMKNYLDKNNYRVGWKSMKSWEIEVYWHMITERKNKVVEGIVSRKSMDQSIQVLNEAYKPFFTFKLVGVNTVENASWFGTSRGDASEKIMKSALRKGSSQTMNIYSNESKKDLLGWATFPVSYAKSPEIDGIAILYSTVPGGSTKNYNEGMTLVHEVGHWLGLYHTFKGGCDGSGDFVSDTPPVAIANYDCKIPQDSCPGDEQKDMLNNFMDYTQDSCMDSFTQGQFDRMIAQWEAYRWKPITKSPTKAPTRAPIQSPTTNPTTDCVMLKVSILTDKYPRDISWNIIDVNKTERIVMSKSDYNKADHLFNESKCVDPTLCLKFEISDEFGDGFCCKYGKGHYVVKYNEEIVTKNYNFNSAFESSNEFGFGCSKPANPIPSPPSNTNATPPTSTNNNSNQKYIMLRSQFATKKGVHFCMTAKVSDAQEPSSILGLPCSNSSSQLFFIDEFAKIRSKNSNGKFCVGREDRVLSLINCDASGDDAESNRLFFYTFHNALVMNNLNDSPPLAVTLSNTPWADTLVRLTTYDINKIRQKWSII